MAACSQLLLMRALQSAPQHALLGGTRASGPAQTSGQLWHMQCSPALPDVLLEMH